MPDIVRSPEPCIGFLTAPNSLASQSYENLFKFVTACVVKYLQYSSPATVGIASDVAADLIEKNPSWKTADFLMCFKFFRMRQDIQELKIFGNTVTGQKLMEMVAVYEEHRAAEHEKMMNEKKGEHMRPTVRTHSESDVKKLMGNLADEAAARMEELRMKGKLKERKEAPDENYFKREHGLQDNAA